MPENYIRKLFRFIPGYNLYRGDEIIVGVIRGMEHSKANKVIGKHNGFKDLGKHLGKKKNNQEASKTGIVLESVYSMEKNGDISRIKRKL